MHNQINKEMISVQKFILLIYMSKNSIMYSRCIKYIKANTSNIIFFTITEVVICLILNMHSRLLFSRRALTKNY